MEVIEFDVLRPENTIHVTVQGGSGGTTDHTILTGRDAENQHPMSAITGLSSALAGKQETISDINTIRSGAAAGATSVQPGELAEVATSGDYDDLTNKPEEVTEATVTGWGFTKNTGTYSKPSGGIPKTDLASEVQTSLGRADSALQEHQSLSAYRTSAEQDVIDNGKQPTITDLETIRSGAALGATALQNVPNTYRTASAQDDIDSGFVKLVGTAGQTIQTNVAVPLNVKNNIVLQHRAFVGFHTHDDNAIGFIGVDGGKPTFLAADGATAKVLQGETITDTGGYYTADTVEGALQEIGAELAGVNTLLGSGVIA